MTRRRRARLSTLEFDDQPMTEINITPLTDVLLVLLVIFLVTANALNNDGFQLAADSGGKAPLESTSPVLRLAGNGELRLNGKTLDEKSIKAELTSLDKSPVLLAHPQVPYGRVIEILDLARLCGHTDLAVAQSE